MVENTPDGGISATFSAYFVVSLHAHNLGEGMASAALNMNMISSGAFNQVILSIANPILSDGTISQVDYQRARENMCEPRRDNPRRGERINELLQKETEMRCTIFSMSHHLKSASFVPDSDVRFLGRWPGNPGPLVANSTSR